MAILNWIGMLILWVVIILMFDLIVASMVIGMLMR